MTPTTPEPAAIVLAAGRSKRMQADRPKVLMPLLGRPMVSYVLDALHQAGVSRITLVVGFQAERVRETFAGDPRLQFALQEPQLGTGHAVQMCRGALADHAGPVIVLAGDQPLIRGTTIQRLLQEYEQQECACVLGSALVDDPTGLGRIVRDGSGAFLRIVEERDASAAEKALREVNVSLYVFDSRRLWAALEEITPDNAQQEWYLTDCIGVLRRQGHRVSALPVVSAVESRGVNTPEHLAEVERLLAGGV